MIKSKTKYQVSREQMDAVFDKNHLPKVKEISPLGNGEFNAAYKVSCEDGRDYVVKLAPKPGSLVCTYEQNMMESEVYWYKMMREYTDICIPEVYAADFTGKIIPTNYFIMEMMEGKPLWEVAYKPGEYDAVQEQKISMLAKIHRIHGEKLGYRQTGLCDTWYEAIRRMVLNLINDCEVMGKPTPNGHRFLQDIERHKELLRSCACSMVNFDLWDSNVLYQEGRLCWIDPERSFWGDPVADFITLGKGQKVPLSEKLHEIEIYNTTAEIKLTYNEETEIRYQVAVGYLALIEEVEKYYRYEPEEENYIRNTVDGEAMFAMVFDILER